MVVADCGICDVFKRFKLGARRCADKLAVLLEADSHAVACENRRYARKARHLVLRFIAVARALDRCRYRCAVLLEADSMIFRRCYAADAAPVGNIELAVGVVACGDYR